MNLELEAYPGELRRLREIDRTAAKSIQNYSTPTVDNNTYTTLQRLSATELELTKTRYALDKVKRKMRDLLDFIERGDSFDL